MLFVAEYLRRVGRGRGRMGVDGSGWEWTERYKRK
jgi:hypothetical protein